VLPGDFVAAGERVLGARVGARFEIAAVAHRGGLGAGLNGILPLAGDCPVVVR
jgi:hypothetical protein